MRWDEVDFGGQIWFMSDQKNDEPHRIPLDAVTMGLLGRRRVEADGSEWIFPSPTSATGHVVAPHKAWKRIMETAGVEELTIHDLRRTHGTYQAKSGANLTLIGRTLNHKTLATTNAIYAHAGLGDIAGSMSRANKLMLELEASEAKDGTAIRRDEAGNAVGSR